ncbi:hypothetical protein ACFVHB_10740 [Kitasatospora sp. NPDC127111]|uniref:hypothetical protein n=1 Tax=Kitasatospora sp. NPDC127111 TaxID=3345363 RepID=UPI00363374E1
MPGADRPGTATDHEGRGITMLANTARRTGPLTAAAAVAVGLSFTAVATGAAGAAADPRDGGVECGEVRAKVERLEGRVTPNACAFMKRQIAFGEIPTGTPPARGDLSHPRVQAYLDIFDDEATLWEAGGDPQRGRTAIGTSITGSLALAPDLRYRGTDVVTEGASMMFGQWNEVTLKGHKVAYPQVARNVLGDDGRTIQARRYYDRYELFRHAAPELRSPFADLADAAPATGAGAGAGAGPNGRRTPERFRADEIGARLAAWNSHDADALAARLAGSALTAPGLAAPLTTAEAKAAYFQRLLQYADVTFKPGQAAFGRSTAYLEWYGTATVLKSAEPGSGEPKGTSISFGIVERVGPNGTWELYFDSLPMIADKAAIGGLFQRLAQP